MAENAIPRELARIEELSNIIERAKSIEEILLVRAEAETCRAYVRSARLGVELQDRAAEVKLRAERMAGDLLTSLRLRGGNRRSSERQSTLTLEDIGVNKSQSHRWQLLASVPECEFRRYVAAAALENKRLSSAGLLRVANTLKKTTHRSNGEKRRNGADRKDIRKVEPGPRSSSRSDSLAELGHHVATLSGILEPIHQAANEVVRDCDRRHIARLLTEMEAIGRRFEATGREG